MASPRLRIGVAGVGHFGRYHALKVAASERAVLAGIFDPDTERAETIGWETSTPSMDFCSLLAACDALVIAAPAEVHHTLGVQALRAGKHVLVEKPIAATLAQADELTATGQTGSLVLQIGHLERFSAAFGAMENQLGAPLYLEATRIAPFKERGTDVSVILDLMIHDLDLILALVASEIESVDAVGAAVASDHPDIANARIRFVNGAVATITASRVALRTERRMRVFAQDGYLAADFANRRLTVMSARTWPPDPGCCRLRHRGSVVAGPRLVGRRTRGVCCIRDRRRAGACRRRGWTTRPGGGTDGDRQHGRFARQDGRVRTAQ